MYTKSTLHWRVLPQFNDRVHYFTTDVNGMNVATYEVSVQRLAVVGSFLSFSTGRLPAA
ncbi:hypothetical protein L0152_24995 [bacterium]|nr:hypothetical protein [bacterium]